MCRVIVLAKRRCRRGVDESAAIRMGFEVLRNLLLGALQAALGIDDAALESGLAAVGIFLTMRPPFQPVAVRRPDEVVRPPGMLHPFRSFWRENVLVDRSEER